LLTNGLRVLTIISITGSYENDITTMTSMKLVIVEYNSTYIIQSKAEKLKAQISSRVQSGNILAET